MTIRNPHNDSCRAGPSHRQGMEVGVVSERTVAGWLRANGLVAPISTDQERCLTVLVDGLGRVYNWPTPTLSTAASVDVRHGMVKVLVRGEVSTFDSDAMTRLVLAAHQHHVRVAISAWTPRWENEFDRGVVDRMRSEVDYEPEPEPWADDDYLPAETYGVLQVLASPRQPAPGHLFERHPGLERLDERVNIRLNRVGAP